MCRATTALVPSTAGAGLSGGNPIIVLTSIRKKVLTSMSEDLGMRQSRIQSRLSKRSSPVGFGAAGPGPSQLVALSMKPGHTKKMIDHLSSNAPIVRRGVGSQAGKPGLEIALKDTSPTVSNANKRPS